MCTLTSTHGRAYDLTLNRSTAAADVLYVAVVADGFSSKLYELTAGERISIACAEMFNDISVTMLADAAGAVLGARITSHRRGVGKYSVQVDIDGADHEVLYDKLTPPVDRSAWRKERAHAP